MSYTKTFFKAYLLLLHLLILVMLATSDFLSLVENTLGRFLPWRSVFSEKFKMLQLSLQDEVVPQGATIFIGDSLIKNLCAAAVTDEAINFGINGDTTLGVLQRICRYNSLPRAGAIVLAIGVNDLISGKNDILTNYHKIVNNLPEGIPLIVNAIFPVDGNILAGGFNQKILEFNAGLNNMCLAKDNCYFINSGIALADRNGNLEPTYHIGDGLHLNKNGYHLWITDLRKTLIKIRQRIN